MTNEEAFGDRANKQLIRQAMGGCDVLVLIDNPVSLGPTGTSPFPALIRVVVSRDVPPEALLQRSLWSQAYQVAMAPETSFMH